MLDLPYHVVILLVDDSENDIEIIRHAIERAGLTNRLSLPASGDEGDSDGRDQAFVATAVGRGNGQSGCPLPLFGSVGRDYYEGQRQPRAPVHQLSERGTYFVTASTYLKAHHFRGRGRVSVLAPIKGSCFFLPHPQKYLAAQLPDHPFHFKA